MNCVFCECGVTQELTTERRSYIDVEEAKRDKRYIKNSKT